MRLTMRWPALAAALLVLLAVGFTACGGDDDGDGGGLSADDFPAPTAPPDDAEEGGTLTVVAAGDVDFLDPGAGYYNFTYMIDFASQRTLLSWPPDETEQPQPDLSEGEPEISDDGRTLTFTIKDGVRFSPPVDREIRAQDFKYAIERGLLPGVATGYLESYLGSLEGFAAAQGQAEQNDAEAPNISGIETPDDRTLILRLSEPVAAIAAQALSLPIGAPVPEEYAREFDAETPSTYNTHVVGTGPYMVENNESGELTGYSPGKEIILVRNPNWDPETDYRPAYLDRIEVKEGFTDVNAATRRILQGESQVNGDILPEPEGLKDAATRFKEQLSLSPSGGNRYITMNTSVPPFDDINVRKAVVASADREQLRLERGGELVGTIANHFIPPGIPGFEEAGGEEGPGFDFLAEPSGNMELAREYMRKAGYDSGRYEGDAQILMVAENAGVDKRVGELARDIFDKLGFEVNFRQVSSDTMYTKFCNVPKANVAVCPNVGWLKDFNDPQTILQPTFDGDAINAANNSNWPELDVPEINQAIDEAVTINDPEERAEAWAEIDETITAQAPAIPYVWDNQPNVRSANVNGVVNLFNGTWDLSHTSLEGGG